MITKFIYKFRRTFGSDPLPEQLLLMKYFKEAGDKLPLDKGPTFFSQSWLVGNILDTHKGLIVWELIHFDFFKEFMESVWDSEGNFIAGPHLVNGQKARLLKDIKNSPGQLLAEKGDVVTIVGYGILDSIVSRDYLRFYVNNEDLGVVEEALSLTSKLGQIVTLTRNIGTHSIKGQQVIITQDLGRRLVVRDPKYYYPFYVNREDLQPYTEIE